MSEKPTRILCLGGGYATMTFVAQMQSAIKKKQVEITVVSKDNFHTFHGFIGEMLVGRIQPSQIVNAARRIFRNARFYNADVETIDVKSQSVTVSRRMDGRQYVVEYDHLFVAIGSVDDLSRYPGISEHAHKLKTYWDCFKVRNHILGMLEMAEMEEDPEERKRLLTFVVVGGGYGGVEVASELHDHVLLLAKKEYPRLHPEEVRVMIVHAGARILPELLERHEPLVAYAEKYLGKTGLEIRVNTRIVSATPEEALLSTGERIPTRTIISSSGTALSPVLDQLPFERDERGRLKTDPTTRVLGSENVWSAGDCAAVPHPKGGTAPSVGVFAMRAGRHSAKSVLATIAGKKAKPFDFAGIGDACSLGQRRAVAQAWGFRMYGIVAWITWRAMFVMFVPTWDRRIRIVLDWFMTPFLGRDIVNIRMDEPYGVRQEIYEPGQDVVRQGDVGKRLYVILTGEAEVVRSGPNGEESLAVLSAGSHFGEAAVFENVRRNATVRAKSRLQVITIGQAEAVSLSSAILPFGEAMRRAPALVEKAAEKATN